jgi:hypothetical protein
MTVDIVDKYLTDDNNPIKNLRLTTLCQSRFLAPIDCSKILALTIPSLLTHEITLLTPLLICP